MKPIYIFDLDGTLANADHRLHFIQGEKKDWRGFFAACIDDKPIKPTITALQCLLDGGATVWIWTGRSDEVAAETIEWLVNNDIWEDDILMRKAGDHRPDHVIKREWLDSLDAEKRGRIVAVFEDRDRVVQMWREAGLTCYQVAPGAF